MHAQDFSGKHQPDLERLVRRYETQLREGSVAFLELDYFLLLIDHYEQQQKNPQALRVLRYAIEQHPFSAVLYIRQAQCLIELERFREALETLEQAKTYEPSNIDLYLTQADAYANLEDLQAVQRTIQEAKPHASREDMAELYVILGHLYELLQDYSNALQSLQKALKRRPDHLLALSRLWNCYEQLENYQDAVDYLTALLDEAPYAHWAWYTLGLAYRYLNDPVAAADAFDYAIVSEERFEPAYWHRIDCLIELDEYGEALDYLERTRESFGEDADLWFRYGQCYEYQGDYAKAREYYAEALKDHNMGGRVHHALGQCYLEEESWHKAEQAFLEAYAADKYNEEFCLALADVYDILDEVDKAHEFYHRALGLAPNLIRIWLHYFEFLIDEESHSLALELVEEARQYVAGVLLDYAHAAILLDQGRRQEGFVVLGHALIQDFSKREYLFRLAPNLEEDAALQRFINDYQVDDYLEPEEG